MNFHATCLSELGKMCMWKHKIETQVAKKVLKCECRFHWHWCSRLHRILCNCHTTLLEDALGPSMSANEGTGASANGCTDASANEAIGQNYWEGSLGRGSREHIQHIQHVQHIKYMQHVQHVHHIQHVQRQTHDYGTANGLILKRQTV